MKNVLNRWFGEQYGPRVGILTVYSSLLLVAMLVIAVLDANVAVFRVINSVSLYTGTALWANLTFLGEGLAVFSLVGLVAIRWPAAAWAMLIGAIVGSIIVHGLKEAFGAMRPAVVLPQDTINIIGPKLSRGSFPSGHTATIAGFATIIYFHVRNRWASASLLALALLVGVSRMAVGAHWPMDVLAGWIVGMLYGSISVFLAERWTGGLKVPAQSGIIVFSVACAIALFVLEPYMHEARGMAEAMMLRWLLAIVGVITGVWALVLLHRPSGLRRQVD